MAKKRDRQYDPLRPRFPRAAILEVTQMNGAVSTAQLSKICTKNSIDVELVRAANVVALDFFGKGRPLDMASTYPTEVAAPVAALRLDEATPTKAESVVAALFEQTVARTPHNAGTMREALLNKLEHAGALTLERREAVDNGFKLADQVARFSRVPRLYAANPALPDSVFQDAQEMALAMANPRVALIKTVEAMNRLRTWERANERDPKEGQAILRIAEKLYHPLAAAVGWKDAADRIQDYVFEYRHPGERKKIVRDVEEIMGEGFYSREKEIVSVGSGFIQTLLEASFNKARDSARSDAPRVEIDVSGRAKPLASVYQKQRLKGYPLENMTDLLAFRVILPGTDKADCYKALGVLQQVFLLKTEDFKDYIVDPSKPYESLHLVATVKDRINPNLGKLVPGELQGKVIEIQVRTQEMDHAAEVGIASHLAYKQNGVVLAGNSFLQKAAERIIREAGIRDSAVQVAGRLVPVTSADIVPSVSGQGLVPEFVVALPRLNAMERQIVFSGLAEMFSLDEGAAIASDTRGTFLAKGALKPQGLNTDLPVPTELSHGEVSLRLTKTMPEAVNYGAEGWSTLTQAQPSVFMERVEVVRGALTALNAGKPMQALPPPKDIFVVREDGSPVRAPFGASLMDVAVAIDPLYVFLRKATVNGILVDLDSAAAKQLRVENGDALQIGRNATDASRTPDSAWLKKGVMKSEAARAAVQGIISEAQRKPVAAKRSPAGTRPHQG